MDFGVPSSLLNHGILLDYPSSYLRLFFTIYFVLIFLLINWIGNKCSVSHVKVQLLKRKYVRLIEMTGWLSPDGLFGAILEFKTLPATLLTILMIVSGILSTISHPIATTLINTEVANAHCPFGTGLVVNPTPDNITQVPPNSAQPYYVVAQAQMTSQANGGQRGIYAKVNRSLNFSADANDVIGQWTCQQNPVQTVYPNDTSVQDLVTAIQKAGLVYGANPPNCSGSLGLQGYSHTVILDSSVADYAFAPFDVRASICTTGNGSDPKIMESFECIASPATIGNILSIILARSTMDSWCKVVESVVYDGRYALASNNTGALLEEVLNSMVMVAGGNDYLHNTTATTETQGCLAHRTVINWAAIAITLADTFLALLILVYWLALCWHIRRTEKNKWVGLEKEYRNNVHDKTPTSTSGWMVQAVRENQTGMEKYDDQLITKRNLRDWQFGPAADVFGLQIIHRDDIDCHSNWSNGIENKEHGGTKMKIRRHYHLGDIAPNFKAESSKASHCTITQTLRSFQLSQHSR